MLIRLGDSDIDYDKNFKYVIFFIWLLNILPPKLKGLSGFNLTYHS